MFAYIIQFKTMIWGSHVLDTVLSVIEKTKISEIKFYFPRSSSAKSLQSCPTLCDPLGCSLSGSSVHGILQARTLECVAVPSSRGSSWPRDWTHVSTCIGRWTLYHYFSPFWSTKHHWMACYPNRRIRFNESSNNLSFISCRVIHSTGLIRTYSKSIHLTRTMRWHPTPVLLPGKSHGWRSLVGCSPWGR